MNKHFHHKTFVRKDQKYDAYYCALCNEWMEPKCTDKECEYCINRPEKPMLVN